MSIFGSAVNQQKYAVLDVETTGLSPGEHRVIEIGVVHLDPGKEPELVFETLINPDCPVKATDIHGITDDDVADAPRFSEVAGQLIEVLSSRVIVGHNVYFDERFVRFELGLLGLELEAPIMCTSGLRSMLNLGKRCALEVACLDAGIDYTNAHEAGSDALACAHLLKHYLSGLSDDTFADLAKRRKLKFVESFNRPLLMKLPEGARARSLKSRSNQGHSITSPTAYREVLMAATSDLNIDKNELEALFRAREEQKLSSDEVTMIHCRVIAWLMSGMSANASLSKSDLEALDKVFLTLRDLGWAPGLGSIIQTRAEFDALARYFRKSNAKRTTTLLKSPEDNDTRAWFACVPSFFNTSLDIGLNQHKASGMSWTQGGTFAFAEGDVVHNSQGGYKPTEDQAEGAWCLQIKQARPARESSSTDPGEVTFDVFSNDSGNRWVHLERFSLSQVEFVALLRFGPDGLIEWPTGT